MSIDLLSNRNFPFLLGLLEIYRRIPLTRELALDEATEHVRSPLSSTAHFPFTLEAMAERTRAALPPTTTEIPQTGPRRTPSATAPTTGRAASGASRMRPLATGSQPSGTVNEDDITEKSQSHLRGKKRKGRQIPLDSEMIRKYGKYSSSIPCLDQALENFLKRSVTFKGSRINLNSSFKLLLKSSLARKTWGKYRSAWRKWKEFVRDTKIADAEKFTPEMRLTFTCWCKTRGNLKASTVNQYLTSLQNLNLLTNSLESENQERLPQGAGNLHLQKILLKGLKNLENGAGQKKMVTAMDLRTLLKIRKGLLKGGWRKVTRTSVWTACLIAFWGSFRLSEILPPSIDRYDQFSDLLWKDLDFGSNQLRICLKSPKVPSGWSNNVDLFPISRKLFCPVRWIKKLKTIQENKKMLNNELPVFRLSSGGGLSRGTFLKIVKKSLSLSGHSHAGFSGKSFRSGIPSELETFPEDFKERHLKALGRWKSSAYQKYIRKEIPEKKKTHQIIANILIKNFDAQEPGQNFHS